MVKVERRVMSKRKKIFLWIMGGLGAFLLLLFIAILLAPRLINLESIREKILATASEKVGGEVRFQTSKGLWIYKGSYIRKQKRRRVILCTV